MVIKMKGIPGKILSINPEPIGIFTLSTNKHQNWYTEKLDLQDDLIYKNDFQFKKRLDLYKYH